jgi:hypothetical protein
VVFQLRVTLHVACSLTGLANVSMGLVPIIGDTREAVSCQANASVQSVRPDFDRCVKDHSWLSYPRLITEVERVKRVGCHFSDISFDATHDS